MPLGLAINDRQGAEGFAQGGIYKECIMLTVANPTPMVTGYKLLVSPALWDKNQFSGFIKKEHYYWHISWPGIAGTYPLLNKNFDNKYKNIRVYVRIFNNETFSIIVEYMALADMHEYLYPHTFQPLELWTNKSVDGAKLNAYNTANRYVGLRVTVYDKDFQDPTHMLLDWIQSEKVVKGIPWKNIVYPAIDNRYYLSVGVKPVNGFVLGQDLTIKLRNFPQYTNSQYYCGIFRVDEQLEQNMEFYDEIFMQYCIANNTADEPFSMATNTILRDKLKNVRGFRYDHLESIAEFTVDDSYFVEKGRYRLFVVVKESCQFRSYLFDEFGINTKRDVITGDLDVTLIKVDDTVISLANGSCLYDVPVCADIEIRMTMDRATYAAALMAKGIQGSWYNYFTNEPTCYISNGEYQVGTNQFPPDSIDWNDNITDLEIIYKFKIPESWDGTTKYVNFVWPFNYGSGNIDYVIGYTALNIHKTVANEIELKSPLGLQKTICDTDAILTQFCFENPTAAHQFRFDLLKSGEKVDDSLLIPVRETDFGTNLDACIDFDYVLAENERQYCLKMRAHKPTVNLVRPCTDIQICRNHIFVNGQDFGWNWCYELIGWLDADIKHVTIFFVEPITFKNLGYFIEEGKAEAYPWVPNIDTSPVILNIQVLRNDGNLYFQSVLFKWSKDVLTNCSKYNLCSGAEAADCPENPILSHTTVWNYATPPPWGSITNKTITGIFTLGGVPSLDVREYRITIGAVVGAWTPYVGPITTGRFNKVELRWTLTYPTCVIELYDCITDEECSAP